jgi:hypothetical protein
MPPWQRTVRKAAFGWSTPRASRSSGERVTHIRTPWWSRSALKSTCRASAPGRIRTCDPRLRRPRRRKRRKTTPSTNGLQTPHILHVDPARSAFQSGPSRERLGQDWATRRAAGEAAAEIAGALRDTTSVVAPALAVMRPESSGRWQRRAVSASPPVSPLPPDCETRSGGRGRRDPRFLHRKAVHGP